MTENSGPETVQEASTRRTTHVTAAVVAVVVLVAGLMTAPSVQHWVHGRQVKNVQRGAAADLELLLAKEKKFFAANGTYTTDLRALTFFPKILLYKIGFVKAGAVKAANVVDHDPSIKDIDALKKALPADALIELAEGTKLNEIDFSRLGSYCADCTATASTFKAIAVANLDEDPVLDVWTIDEKGVLTHLVDDLSQ